MAMMPLLLAVIAVMLAQLGGTLLLDVTLVGLWGVAFGIIPVSWSTLVTTTVPDEPETGGGVFVATANLAIAVGSRTCGIVFGQFGISAQYMACAAVLLIGFVGATRLGS